MSRSPAVVATAEVRGNLSDEQLKTIDAAVGAQVRLRRILLGLSQEAVSNSLGLTFQQLQKYEHGTNRISGSRLYQLGMILHAPVSFFFETVDVSIGANAAEDAIMSTSDADEVPAGIMQKRKTVELVRAFYAIDDDKQHTAALNMLKNMARAGK